MVDHKATMVVGGGIGGIQASLDLAEMEEAAGFAEKAEDYRTLAGAIREAFNRLLWKEDAPGGPRSAPSMPSPPSSTCRWSTFRSGSCPTSTPRRSS